MNYEENNKNNNKKKNTILIVIMATLVVILGGVTYAFFNYTRTGETNLLTVGSISFNSTQETVNLTNLFPVRSEELDEYIENVDKISVSITGNTDYEEGLEYRMSFVDVNNSFFDKTVPLSYRATATNIGTLISNNEYDLSKGGATQVYSMNETGVIENDNYFLTGYIPTGVNANGTVEIAAYIDGNKIAITDTYNNYHTTDTCFTFNNGTITNYDANCEKDVVIPSMINNIQVTSIANNAFKGKQLKSVVIPDTVTSIGMRAFYSCGNLISINLPNSITCIERETFYHCNRLRSVTIPNSVKTIASIAFQYCWELKELTIGSGVESIGENAFNNNYLIEEVNCLGTVPPAMLQSNVFNNATYENGILHVPGQSKEAYRNANYWNMFASIEGYRNDVNGDGIVSIKDVSALIDMLLGGNTNISDYPEADINGDGIVSIGDVTALVDILLMAS